MRMTSQFQITNKKDQKNDVNSKQRRTKSQKKYQLKQQQLLLQKRKKNVKYRDKINFYHCLWIVQVKKKRLVFYFWEDNKEKIEFI